MTLCACNLPSDLCDKSDEDVSRDILDGRQEAQVIPQDRVIKVGDLQVAMDVSATGVTLP